MPNKIFEGDHLRIILTKLVKMKQVRFYEKIKKLTVNQKMTKRWQKSRWSLTKCAKISSVVLIEASNKIYYHLQLSFSMSTVIRYFLSNLVLFYPARSLQQQTPGNEKSSHGHLQDQQIIFLF